ncbi:hypothetical protein HMPREF1863_00422 [Aedoeadaptatus coxii]|uniref:Uncharacterized protein n=1 Tax=Aedoeadaptatus coxii TaxID=755172 RepID=A0A134AJK1_9FIRM|nr:hypothetical protein HMPREF1863_00422 [Peptoniphilus coxii]
MLILFLFFVQKRFIKEVRKKFLFQKKSILSKSLFLIIFSGRLFLEKIYWLNLKKRSTQKAAF